MTRLLIVDDSSIMRRSIETNLRDLDVQIVGTASNGIEAIEMIEKFAPEVVTLDITMPEMDGLECLTEIMKIAPNTKVMVITALSDKLTGLQALDKGARGYIFKPVSPEKLRESFTKLANKE